MNILCFYLVISVFVRESNSAQTSSKEGSNQDKQSLKPPSQSSSTSGNSNFNPLGPLIKCSFLPSEFIECHPLVDHKGNKTARDLMGHGCVKFGGSYHRDVEHTKALCEALPDIECYGARQFFRDGFPCVNYTVHYFVTTLIYSILLGFLGMDRFCLVSNIIKVCEQNLISINFRAKLELRSGNSSPWAVSASGG